MGSSNGATIPFYQVDAFTDRLFGGNPAAVCPLTAWLADDVMQSIATENNLSETAFFVPEGVGFALRWFTPTVEVDLCGHATLASAHVLFAERGYEGGRVTFTSRSGPLHVDRRDDGRLALDFPANRPQAMDATDARLSALRGALGVAAGAPVLDAGHFKLVVLDRAADVAALAPDMPALDSACAALADSAVIVTAPGTDGVDFVSRMFAPRSGIAEDPVTGSAHCVLTPYWSGRLGRPALSARQVSARVGVLDCTLKGERVQIAGRAVTFARGEIVI